MNSVLSDYRLWMKMVAVYPALMIVALLVMRTSRESEEGAPTVNENAVSSEEVRLMNEQQFCVVHPTHRLRDCGTPYKLQIKGTTVFVCSQSCSTSARMNPERTLKSLDQLRAKAPKRVA